LLASNVDCRSVPFADAATAAAAAAATAVDVDADVDADAAAATVAAVSAVRVLWLRFRGSAVKIRAYSR